MASNRKRQWGPRPVADLASRLLDPVLRKRAGVSVGLIQSWDEIVGERIAHASRPHRIAWPRRMSEADPFEPATLVIACEGFAALAVQHETGEIIDRVNAFLGFAAIGRIKIVQRPVNVPARPPSRQPAQLQPAEGRRLADLVGGIEDDALRASLQKLGAEVLGARGGG